MQTRPNRELLHMQTAFAWAQRATCSLPDRQCGAVITTGDLRQILSFGYNGPGKRLPNDFCARWRNAYIETEGGGVSRCPCLHAEDNAIAFVDGSIPGKSIFITMTPCLICAQRIVNANITTVYYRGLYRDTYPLRVLRDASVDLVYVAESGKLMVPELVGGGISYPD
jgi:dCMP deaminase